MAYKTVLDNVIFIEGSEEYISNFGQIVYKKGMGLYNNQLKNLDDVKAQLAQKTKELGGNAVVNFKYGQKNTSWIKSLLLRFDDNVNWFGEGMAVLLPEDRYYEILKEIENRK